MYLFILYLLHGCKPIKLIKNVYYKQLNISILLSVAHKANTCVSLFWENWLDKSDMTGFTSLDAPEQILQHTPSPVQLLNGLWFSWAAPMQDVKLSFVENRAERAKDFFHWNKDYKKQQLNLLFAKFQKSTRQFLFCLKRRMEKNDMLQESSTLTS